MNLQPKDIPSAVRECISYQLAKKSLVKEDNESWDNAMTKAFNSVPQVRFIEQAQYLREHMLPRIEKTRGTDSADYKFYYSVFESLMYAITMADRDYSLRMRLTNEKLLNEIYHKKIIFYEMELQKHTTLEELSAKELTAELLKRKTGQ